MNIKHILLLVTFCVTHIVFSQEKKFPKITYTSEVELDKKIEDLARELLSSHHWEDRTDSIFKVSIYYLATKNYENHLKTLPFIDAHYKKKYPAFAAFVGKQSAVYAKSKLLAKKQHISFEESYFLELKKYLSALKEEHPFYLYYFLRDKYKGASDNLKKLLQNQTDSLTIDEVSALIRIHNDVKIYEEIKGIMPKAFVSHEKEHYIIQDSITIKNGDAVLALRVIRNRKIKEKLPTILKFSIYPKGYDREFLKNTAKKGYNGIIAYTRGKWISDSELHAFEHDGEDANVVIDWISKQSWSDGEVGMIGGSYLGFAQWAATKKLHPALKTIIPQVAVGIGIDYPMQNNVFMLYMLRWIHYVENNKLTDYEVMNDDEKWKKVYTDWFESGRSFRALDSVEGKPNKTFQRWLDHPNRDEFWQNMVADKEDFSKIDIPVLTTTGYFDDDQSGALYYVKEHYTYYKNPEHYLLIGPFSHSGGQGIPEHTLRGYTLDEVAKISIDNIAFEWFDYVLKGKEKPTLLKDKINYQVMEANTWKHVSSLEDLYKNQQTFYLSNKKDGDHYQLKTTKGNSNKYILQEIDFSDRKKIHAHVDFEKDKIVDTILKTNNGLVFKTAPFEKDIEIGGSFSGELSVMINKKDMDYTLQLYEQKADGSYFYLSNHIQRASHSESYEKRKLLVPHQKTKLAFKDTYFTSKKIEKGSRLILIVNINKNPQWQVNYGTGKDVSTETIKDAGEPLQVKWFTDSYIKIPVN